MQVLGQLISLLFTMPGGPFGLLAITLISIVLTVMAMFRHGDVKRHKTSLPRFSPLKYFLLNVTFVLVMTGLPLIALYFVVVFVNPVQFPNASIYAFNACLNAPGAIYFIQASSFFPKQKFKFRLPKYL